MELDICIFFHLYLSVSISMSNSKFGRVREASSWKEALCPVQISVNEASLHWQPAWPFSLRLLDSSGCVAYGNSVQSFPSQGALAGSRGTFELLSSPWNLCERSPHAPHCCLAQADAIACLEWGTAAPPSSSRAAYLLCDSVRGCIPPALIAWGSEYYRRWERWGIRVGICRH